MSLLSNWDDALDECTFKNLELTSTALLEHWIFSTMSHSVPTRSTTHPTMNFRSLWRVCRSKVCSGKEGSEERLFDGKLLKSSSSSSSSTENDRRWFRRGLLSVTILNRLQSSKIVPHSKSTTVLDSAGRSVSYISIGSSTKRTTWCTDLRFCACPTWLKAM